MKKKVMNFGLMVFLTLSLPAQAAVVDEFRCEVKVVKPDGTEFLKTKAHLAAVRKPFSTNQDPDIQYTKGDVYMQSRGVSAAGKFQIILVQHYLHSMKVNSAGTPIHANQKTCLSISAEVGGVSRSKSCADFEGNPDSAHLAPSLGMPGDPVEIQEGVPLFNPNALGSYSLSLGDIGTLNFECSYQGTLH